MSSSNKLAGAIRPIELLWANSIKMSMWFSWAKWPMPTLAHTLQTKIRWLSPYQPNSNESDNQLDVWNRIKHLLCLYFSIYRFVDGTFSIVFSTLCVCVCVSCPFDWTDWLFIIDFTNSLSLGLASSECLTNQKLNVWLSFVFRSKFQRENDRIWIFFWIGLLVYDVTMTTPWKPDCRKHDHQNEPEIVQRNCCGFKIVRLTRATTMIVAFQW